MIISLLIVRFTSILVLVGIGSFVIYKLFTKDKQKKKRKNSKNGVVFKDLSMSQTEISDPVYSNCNDAEISFPNSCASLKNPCTSTPYPRGCDNELESLRSTSPTPSFHSLQSLPYIVNDSTFDVTNTTLFNSTTTNGAIGDVTVAKLDQLLAQIQDIKKSVVEIDQELCDVGSTSTFHHQDAFHIAGDTSTNPDESERNTEPQTPSLEWDLTDINGHGEFYDDEFRSPHHVNIVSDQIISKRDSELFVSLKDEAGGATSPPSSCTSGKFSSTLSSPLSDDENANRTKALQKMIDEANRLGLTNNLLEVLLKDKKRKRDSAYFED